MGKLSPIGAMADTKGARAVKGLEGGPQCHNFLKLTLDIFKLQMKSKKKNVGSLETYT